MAGLGRSNSTKGALALTTDFRDVLGELVRAIETGCNTISPGYTAATVGLLG